MKKVCLQASHVNIKNNSDVNLRSGTGAANEQKFTLAVRNALADELAQYGIECYMTDGCANDDKNVTGTTWDLFLAIHFDADIYNDSGGFVDFADPNSDKATKESQRIAKLISASYFRVTKIKNVPARSNKNTRFYYMWDYLTAKTPCVLIECGIGNRKPKDYDVLFDNQKLVVQGILEGILDSFGIEEKNTSEVENLYKELSKKASEISEEARYLSETTKDMVSRIKSLSDDLVKFAKVLKIKG